VFFIAGRLTPLLLFWLVAALCEFLEEDFSGLP
jgi:hypothetical protein